jgi:hypothetical protein
MYNFKKWMEARIPKPKVLDKAPAYSTDRLPRPNGPHKADDLLRAFEAGTGIPPGIIGDALEDEGHPNSIFFRSPEMMAKAHFHMALPGSTWRGGLNDASHAQFRNHLLDRYGKLFSGQYKPNYRSTKGQIEHGQYVSFFHDLIHAPDRIPPEARNP